jgi:plasmid maintenance system antidote protein VapI
MHLAIRPARFLGTSPEFWMSLQSAYELKQAGNVLRSKIEKIQPHKSAA